MNSIRFVNIGLISCIFRSRPTEIKQKNRARSHIRRTSRRWI